MLLQYLDSKPGVNPSDTGIDDVVSFRFVKQLVKDPIVNRDLLVTRP